jgi:hypothetical protein
MRSGRGSKFSNRGRWTGSPSVTGAARLGVLRKVIGAEEGRREAMAPTNLAVVPEEADDRASPKASRG